MLEEVGYAWVGVPRLRGHGEAWGVGAGWEVGVAEGGGAEGVGGGEGEGGRGGGDGVDECGGGGGGGLRAGESWDGGSGRGGVGCFFFFDRGRSGVGGGSGRVAVGHFLIFDGGHVGVGLAVLVAVAVALALVGSAVAPGRGELALQAADGDLGVVLADLSVSGISSGRGRSRHAVLGAAAGVGVCCEGG